MLLPCEFALFLFLAELFCIPLSDYNTLVFFKD
jgi:hypothetical protein